MGKNVLPRLHTPWGTVDYDDNEGPAKDFDGASTYSPEGYLTQVKDAAGAVTTYIWTKAGSLQQVILPDGSGLKWTYDEKGQLVRMAPLPRQPRGPA